MDSNEIKIDFRVKKRVILQGEVDVIDVVPNWMAMLLLVTKSTQEDGIFFLCANTEKVCF